MQIVVYYRNARKGITIIDNVQKFSLRDELYIDYSSDSGHMKEFSIPRTHIKLFEVRL